MFIFAILITIVSFLGFYSANILPMKIAFIFAAAAGVCGVRLVLNVVAARIHKKGDRGEFFGIIETVKDGSYALAPIIIGTSYAFIGLNGIFLVNVGLAILLFFFGLKIFQEK